MNRLILLLFLLPPLLVGCQNQPTLRDTSLTHAAAFAADVTNYQMDIQAAGLASLPAATLRSGELYVEYTYVSGSESRAGKMTLTDRGNHHFAGEWRTEADNGNVYSGKLFFDFRPDGTASGNYTFGGATYAIPILRR